MKTHFAFSKKSGFTIVGAVVALAAVLAGLIAVAQMTGFLNLGEKRLDNVVAAEQVLALTARMVLEENFDTTLSNCKLTSTNGKIPLDENAGWNCLDSSQQLDPALVVDSKLKFQSRINDKADADARGKFCVELTRCESKASEHLLDITITAFYADPTANGIAHRKQMKFRKSKW